MHPLYYSNVGGRHNHMVIGFTTIYAISAYHYY